MVVMVAAGGGIAEGVEIETVIIVYGFMFTARG
jgi:hypothetical protein